VAIICICRGSKSGGKAVAECLEPLLPTFRHTLEKLQGDPSDCAALRYG